MEFYLSDDEIIVLASLMGEGIVYGLESSLFDDWGIDSEARVKEIIDDFTKREWIDVDFMGTVHMNDDLYDLISCIVHPDSILHVQQTTKDIYYYRNKNLLFQMTKSNTYHHLTNEINTYAIEGENIREEYTISNEVLQKIEECYECFDFEGALQLLDGQEWIENIVDNRDEGIYFSYLEWNERELIDKKQCRLGFKDNKIYEVIKQVDGSLLIKGGKTNAVDILEKMFERRFL